MNRSTGVIIQVCEVELGHWLAFDIQVSDYWSQCVSCVISLLSVWCWCREKPLAKDRLLLTSSWGKKCFKSSKAQTEAWSIYCDILRRVKARCLQGVHLDMNCNKWRRKAQCEISFGTERLGQMMLPMGNMLWMRAVPGDSWSCMCALETYRSYMSKETDFRFGSGSQFLLAI